MSAKKRSDATYRGESPPKKFARILFWNEVRSLLGKRFTSSNYLAIPSQCAGDLATLTAMGVCEHQIFCVDTDKHAIAAARLKYPNANYANVPFWNAFKSFPNLRGTLGCAFIDLCCPIRSEVISHILELGHHTKLLGFECMYGRETGDVLKALRLPDHANDSTLLPRLMFVQRVPSKGMYFSVHSNWAYMSHSLSHIGKPMFISLGSLKFTPSKVYDFKQVKFTEKELRDACMNTPEDRRLWNVDESTATAWRAHESRGTYR